MTFPKGKGILLVKDFLESTAASTLPWSSSLEAYPEYFGLASFHNYVNQSLKINLSPYTQPHIHIHKDQISNIHWIIEKARECQKNISSSFIDDAKAFDCVDHNKLWRILQEIGIPDHLTCLLRNLYAGQEATFRTRHGSTDWFQIGKGVHQSCILSPCLFNLYAEYIMRNAGLDKA